MSVIVHTQAGANDQPSPSIWGDCPMSRLNDAGLGWYFHENFLGAPLVNTTITAALLARLSVGAAMSIDGDADTAMSMKAGEMGGYLDIETDGDDNDAVALFTEPMGKIIVNSGQKMWFEARMELGAIADQGMFFGLIEEAGASKNAVADGAAALIGESLIGFQILSDDTDGVDAVFKLDGGAVVEMKSVINNVASGGNIAADLTADTEFKLGMRFDGREHLQIFFNGYKVYTYTINTSTFPDNVNMGVVLCLKTGAAAARSVAIPWVRAAYQARS